jgi:hypothetical protein
VVESRSDNKTRGLGFAACARIGEGGAEEAKDRTDVIGRCTCTRWVSRCRDYFSFLLESDRDREGKARLIRLQ